MTGIWLDRPNYSPAPNPFSNGGAIAGPIYTYFTSGGTITPLYFNGDALYAQNTRFSVYNSGVLTAAKYGNGIGLQAGGIVTNTSSGTISGVSGIEMYANGSVANLGTIVGVGNFSRAVELVNGGNVTNGSAAVKSARISGVFEGVDLEGAGGILVNYGSITGTYAAVARPGSLVINNKGASATGAVDGFFVGSYGYPASGSGTVVNAGFVQATGGGGRGNGIVMNATIASVTNSGTVMGTGGSGATGLGIAFNYGGYLLNQQSGLIQGYAAGVSADHGPLTAVNSGSIVGTIAGLRVLS